MEDEVKTGVEPETEATENNEPVYADDDNDPEWDAVTWGKDDESENAGEEDIDGKEDEGDADHSDAEKPAETDGPAKDEEKPEAADTDQYLELKHFDEIRKVGKEEAKVLAQKGMDYDNIRNERDTFRTERDNLKAENERFKAMEEFLNEVRGDQFATVEDFMTDTRARMLADKNGTKYEDELAALKAKQEPKEKPKEAAKPSPVDEFLTRFPGVKAEEIPESVWAEVKQTGDLVGAYVRHTEKQKADEIQKLKDEIETLKQNQKNASRSAGSSRSAGNKGNKSLIAELWDNGD